MYAFAKKIDKLYFYIQTVNNSVFCINSWALKLFKKTGYKGKTFLKHFTLQVYGPVQNK